MPGHFSDILSQRKNPLNFTSKGVLCLLGCLAEKTKTMANWPVCDPSNAHHHAHPPTILILCLGFDCSSTNSWQS